MKLSVKFTTCGYSNCDIEIRAKGFLAALVFWADLNGPLSGWSSFAAIPIQATGNAHYRFEGSRTVPAGATHIYVKCIAQDFSSVEEAVWEIPVKYRAADLDSEPLAEFSLMSDLHLSRKHGMIHSALRLASSVILMPGDLINDGYAEQFEGLRHCIEESASDKLILSVTGNHDQLLHPDMATINNYAGYYKFQKYLFQRSKKMGYSVYEDASGAYLVQIGEIEVIGLQCVSNYRKFVFPESAQLKWPDRHLDHDDTAQWHIILCHAPLIAHNPHRKDGAPYLSRDAELQQIVDSHKNIIFLSGHTHDSPNMKQGNVEYQAEKQILYIDAGSVTPTELSGEPLQPSEWKDGVITELTLYSEMIEIRTKSIRTGISYPRGYYRFRLEKDPI